MQIAVVQIEPVINDVERNIDLTVAGAERAIAQGAGIVVLPELASSGYVFRSRDEAFAASEVVGDGPVTRAWAEVAARHAVYLVAGQTERQGGKLFNSAVMYGPDGHLATYRKAHLWDEEALYFEPGDHGFPVVATPVGRLGMMICYDGWFPESYRALADQAVDIVCVPTNWVPIPGQAPDRPAMATILTMANAHCNGVIVAAADRVGVERGQEFIGQSLIVDDTGWPVAGPASRTEPQILVADVGVSAARKSRSWGAFNNPVKDRRPDAYGAAAVHR